MTRAVVVISLHCLLAILSGSCGLLGFPGRASIRIVATDDQGQLHKFQVDQSRSALQNCEIDSGAFLTVHRIDCPMGAAIDVTVTAERPRMLTARRTSILVASPRQVVTLRMDTDIADRAPGIQPRPRRIILDHTLCKETRALQWMDLFRSGDGLKYSIAIEGCTLDLTNVLPGQYAALMYRDGIPIAGARFSRSFRHSASEDTVRFVAFD